eukprot:6273192-Prymnesium_polylepis.1
MKKSPSKYALAAQPPLTAIFAGANGKAAGGGEVGGGEAGTPLLCSARPPRRVAPQLPQLTGHATAATEQSPRSAAAAHDSAAIPKSADASATLWSGASKQSWM